MDSEKKKMLMENHDKEFALWCALLAVLGALFSGTASLALWAMAYLVGVLWIMHALWRTSEENKMLKEAWLEREKKFDEMRADLIASGCEVVRWNKIAELACSQKVSDEAVKLAEELFKKSPDTPGSIFIPVQCSIKKTDDQVFRELVLKESSIIPDLGGQKPGAIDDPSAIQFKIVGKDEVEQMIGSLLSSVMLHQEEDNSSSSKQ